MLHTNRSLEVEKADRIQTSLSLLSSVSETQYNTRCRIKLVCQPLIPFLWWFFKCIPPLKSPIRRYGQWNIFWFSETFFFPVFCWPVSASQTFRLCEPATSLLAGMPIWTLERTRLSICSLCMQPSVLTFFLKLFYFYEVILFLALSLPALLYRLMPSVLSYIQKEEPP